MRKKQDFEQISESLKVISHPIRLQIISALLKDECNVSKIQEKLGLPQATVSQHLALLRRSGVVQARREGARVCYHIVDPRVRKIIEVISQETE